MIMWIMENLATILISMVLLAIVALIIFSMVRRKQKGQSSCGCNCAQCPMGGGCHPKK